MKDRFKLRFSSPYLRRFFVTLVIASIAYACTSGPKNLSDEIENDPTPVASNIPVGHSTAPPAVRSNDSDVTISISSESGPDGSLILLTAKGYDVSKSKDWKVSFEGVEFPVFKTDDSDTVQSAVVLPFNTKPRHATITMTWKLANAIKTQTLPVDVIDGKYRHEVLSVDPAHVNPPKKAIKRIMAEQKEIGRLYWTSDSVRHWKGSFILPINSEITSPFGNKRVYNGEMKSFHQGLDLRAPVGTPIFAPNAARVAMAKDLYFTGNTVILDHGMGLFTIQGHMSELKVKKGEKVEKGQLLGLSGMTGRASGPHLHWGAVLQRLKFNPQDLTRVLR